MLSEPRLPRSQRGRLAAQHHQLRRIKLFYQRGKQRIEGIRQIGDGVPCRVDGAGGGIEIAGFAEQMAEPRQCQRSNAVAGRGGLVGIRFGTIEQPFVVIGGEEEAAVIAIFEMREQAIGERDGEVEIIVAPARLQQLEHAVEQKGVVVEIGTETGAAILVHRPQAAVVPQPGADEIARALRRCNIARLVPHAAGACISRRVQRAVSWTMRSNSGSGVICKARLYSASSAPLSYSIFSKCGISHSASTL